MPQSPRSSGIGRSSTTKASTTRAVAVGADLAGAPGQAGYDDPGCGLLPRRHCLSAAPACPVLSSSKVSGGYPEPITAHPTRELVTQHARDPPAGPTHPTMEVT